MASVRSLQALIAGDPRPVLGILTRRMSSLRTAWNEFAKAHVALFGIVADDKMEGALVVFHA